MPKKTQLMQHLEEQLGAAGHDPHTLMRGTKRLLRSYNILAWRAALEPAAPADDGTAFVRQMLSDDTTPAPHTGYSAACQTLRRTLEAIAAYPENGALYHRILNTLYFTPNPPTDGALWPELHLERSTYYQRKQEAIALFASLLAN